MLELFLPDYIFKSIYEIPFNLFEEGKFDCVFIDIDNTLVSYDVEMPDKIVRELLSKFENNSVRTVLVSNNKKERVELFCKDLKVEYLYRAKKPSIKAYSALIKKLGLDPKRCIAVGDQIFTDVLAAKRLGMSAILVLPVKGGENIFFRFKRAFEKPFIQRYNRLKKKGKI